MNKDSYATMKLVTPGETPDREVLSEPTLARATSFQETYYVDITEGSHNGTIPVPSTEKGKAIIARLSPSIIQHLYHGYVKKLPKNLRNSGLWVE